MPAVGFAAIFAGVVLTIAGVTGSSIASVVKGKPDKTKAQPVSTVPGSAIETPAGKMPEASGKTGKALAAAQTQLGTPYKWGGELERAGFDCSGLVQWAYGKAGITLPRTAQAQYDATERISPGEATAGDLVFFGQSATDIGHVGIVTAAGRMLDATHTGAFVEYSNFPAQLGASWGEDKVIGYGRPR